MALSAAARTMACVTVPLPAVAEHLVALDATPSTPVAVLVQVAFVFDHQDSGHVHVLAGFYDNLVTGEAIRRRSVQQAIAIDGGTSTPQLRQRRPRRGQVASNLEGVCGVQR